jgi:hypothetical protein
MTDTISYADFAKATARVLRVPVRSLTEEPALV